MLNKKTSILIFLLLSNCVAFGQIFKDFTTMGHVYKDWLNRGACDTLYYTENVNPEALNSTIKLISSSKTFPLYDLYNGTETQPLTITLSEQSYLIEELRKLKTFNWPAKMFPKSKRILQKDINSVFAATNQFPEEKFHSCSLIYSFSKPIFFRNGTVCLYIDQEIYSGSNTRLFTQFFSKINGIWEEYADVYTHLANDGSPTKSSADTIVSRIIQMQIGNNSSNQLALGAEQLQGFGKRVILAFKSQDRTLLAQLFPTLEQRVAIAKLIGIPSRNRSSESLRGNQAMAIINFEYKCGKILDTAKIFKINWANGVYSDAKKSEIILPVKDNKGNQITFTNLNVEFIEGSRKFQLTLGGIYFVDNSWKTTSILGLKEIKKE